MNYKFILIFACVILHTNGFKFGRSGGGGARGGGGFKNFGSSPARTFISPSLNSPRTFNSHSYNPPRPLFSSLSVPPPRSINSISSRPFTPSNTGKLTPVSTNNPSFGFLNGVPRNNFHQSFGNTGNALVSEPNVRAIGFKNPSNNPVNSKLTPVTSNNPDFGFLKSMPRNNMDKKFDNPSLTDSKKLNTGSITDVHTIGFKNPSHTPVNGKVTPVTSSNPNFGLFNGMSRNNLDKTSEHPSLPGNTKSNTVGVWNTTPKSNIVPTDFKVNQASQQPKTTNFEQQPGNVISNKGNFWDSTDTPNNNIGGISNISHNHGWHQPKLSSSGPYTGLAGVSILNTLHKLKTRHHLSHHPNHTHFQNSTNNLKQTNKTVEVLLKDLEAVRKNFTDVKHYLNTTSSQAKEDVLWIQQQLQQAAEVLHELNSTENRFNNTNYNSLLALTNEKILNLSDFIKLVNSTNSIGHKNYTNHHNAGSLSDLKNHLPLRIKTAYSSSAIRQSNILKSQEHVSDHHPENSSTINYARSQLIIAISLIISLLIVI